MFIGLIGYIVRLLPSLDNHKGDCECVSRPRLTALYFLSSQILMVSKKPGLSYFAVFLAAAGIYPLIPNTIAWVSNNVSNACNWSWRGRNDTNSKVPLAHASPFFPFTLQAEGAYKRSLTMGMVIGL